MHKHLIFSLFTLLLLASCGGKKGEVRIRGELKGINQADLFLFSQEGYIDHVDTIHVLREEIDHSFRFDGMDGEFTILYPNFSTQSFRASSGDVIKIEGDARQLSDVQITGPQGDHRLPVKQSEMVFPTRMPRFTLKMRDGKTVRREDYKGKYLLLVFWANWMPGSTEVLPRTRELLKENADSLQAISYSMDLDTVILRYSEMRDSITYGSYCDQRSFSGKLVKDLGIVDVPYYVLVDPKYNIIDHGRDIKKIKGIKK